MPMMTKDRTVTGADQVPEPREVLIRLPERFTFQSNREFRAAYGHGETPAQTYVVDCGGTLFIDSAGLGMLLQLCEHAGSNPQRVRLVNGSREIRNTLVIAGFGDHATLA